MSLENLLTKARTLEASERLAIGMEKNLSMETTEIVQQVRAIKSFSKSSFSQNTKTVESLTPAQLKHVDVCLFVVHHGFPRFLCAK